jgi:glutamate synthase (NADPH/NADH) large chain
MLEHDELRLKMLISKHLESTGSSRAAQILDLWDRYLPLFKKVMPIDYRRALVDRRTRKPEREGLQVEAIAGE